MKIRIAKKSDHKEFMKLLNDFIDDKKYLKTGNDSFIKFLAHPNSYTYLLEDNKRVVGFISFSTRNVIRYSKPIAEIEELYILPACRSKGFGWKLIKTVIDEAKKIGCSRMYIGSEFKWKTAHRVYESIGFEKKGYQFIKKFRK